MRHFRTILEENSLFLVPLMALFWTSGNIFSGFQTDRHPWKHNHPATSLAGANDLLQHADSQRTNDMQ